MIFREDCRAFGLRVSYKHTPMYEEAPDGADVVIRRSTFDLPHTAATAEVLTGTALGLRPALLWVGAAQFFVRLAGIADFKCGQREILYSPLADVSQETINWSLMGYIAVLWLEARGDVVLHGAGAVIGGRAVGFLGSSGVGKSSLCLALDAAGVDVLGDDQFVLRKDSGGQVVAVPSLASIKATPSALSAFGFVPDQFDLVHAGHSKRRFEVRQSDAIQRGRPLSRIYVLRRTPGHTIAKVSRLSGTDGVRALLSNAFAPRSRRVLGAEGNAVDVLAQVARAAPVLTLELPDSLHSLGHLVAELALRPDF